MNISKNITCLLICIQLVTGYKSASAQNEQLSVPAIFSEHMVLQAGKPVQVWGKAAPGAKVTVDFSGQTVSTSSDSHGNWHLHLAALQASFIPGVLTIRSAEQSISFSDVLVGEVWLCSGQSNMVMPLGNITDPFFGVDNGDKEINAPLINGIRIYNDNNLEEYHLKLRVWQKADAGAKAAFSAVAWFFGKKLQQQLGVPVGIINISAGGSPIQEWMTPASANADTLIKRYNQIYAMHKTDIQDYAQKSYEYWKYGQTNKNLTPPAPLQANIMLAGRFGKPGALFNRMLSPVIPFSIRGFAWYQGESNADYLADASYYNHLLKTMVNDWREAWQQEQLPFYIVQLPCWNRGPYWPLFKLRQLQAATGIGNSGIVITADISDSTDLHPRQKQPVGERLAMLALNRTYHKNVVHQGPVVENITFRGPSLVITFKTNGNTNVLLTTGSWNDVEIAGNDGIYHPVTPSISGNAAIVKSEYVSSPRYIRYGWKKTYTPSLFNSDGYPAAAFVYKIAGNNKFELKESKSDIISLNNQ